MFYDRYAKGEAQPTYSLHSPILSTPGLASDMHCTTVLGRQCVSISTEHQSALVVPANPSLAWPPAGTSAGPSLAAFLEVGHRTFQSTPSTSNDSKLSTMKQRHTYLLPEVSGVDPEDIYLSDSTLQFAKAGQAAEEWRLTLGWEFLPDEVG